MAVTIGVPGESFPGERRVGLTPRAAEALGKLGASVVIEQSAGVAAGFPDDQYVARGARIGTRAEVFQQSGIVVQVRSLGVNPEQGRADLPLLRPGQLLIGFGEPLTAVREVSELARTGVSFFAMELMPRITRAQSMDALSSMATIAGYRAVLMGAEALPKIFPMLMTAAGTITAARVLVLGAGVAGLQAIATARRLGAVVSAYDVRSAVKEQVESLGAKFVVLDLDTGSSEGQGGYAKAMDEEFYRRQRALLTEVLREQDVVITTAAVPGKKAPILVTAEMASAMAPGSVIVDIAAERGGNCELTKPGETVVHQGISILGPLNVPSTTPYHASQMYGSNLTAFLKLMVKNGELTINREDEIIRETLVTHGGEVVNARVSELLGAAAMHVGERN
ncbi:MAG: Re/Si-specific NAD(P)(+) transhydrogenase subunit alpha [Bryobacteraceae bacterium]